jgi:amino acid transporter
VDLTLLGIGAIIGAGIFAFTGMAAAIGGRGVMGGAALIFLAYLGFDAISTAAEEIAVAWAMSFACALGGNSETSREPVITTMA